MKPWFSSRWKACIWSEVSHLCFLAELCCAVYGLRRVIRFSSSHAFDPVTVTFSLFLHVPNLLLLLELFVYLRLIIGILSLCISAHLTVLLLLNPVLNLAYFLRLITSSHSHASASDSIFDHWRYINSLLTLTLTCTSHNKYILLTQCAVTVCLKKLSIVLFEINSLSAISLLFYLLRHLQSNYLRRCLASGEGIVSLGVCHAVCLCVRRISLDSEGNVLSSCEFAVA